MNSITVRSVPFVMPAATCLMIFFVGCKTGLPPATMPPRPNVGPTAQTDVTDTLQLDASLIEPLYQELVSIDMPTVIRVAAAENFDIRQARQQVALRRGRLESAQGRAFPVLVPTVFFEDVQGQVRATEGNLVGVNFNTFNAAVALQWLVNPGVVHYDIIAAKKRLAASEHQEQEVIMEMLGRGANQYYDLVLAQAGIATAQQGVSQAQEFLRIQKLREQTGTGIIADVLRAQAQLAERQQDLTLAVNAFYNASVDLALTLHLDASITLAPRIEELSLITLVREDLDLDELLGLAVQYRPDLASVRLLVEAIAADADAAWWGGFGPTVLAGYQYGGITANAANDGKGTYAFKDNHRFGGGLAWRLGLSSFGDIKVAHAIEEQVLIEADRQVAQVRAQVVRALQKSKMNRELIGKANQQLTATDAAYRLTQAHFEAGAMTTLDVLQSQDAGARARLRYAEAVVNYNSAQVDLLAALGLLDSQSLTPNAESS